MEKSIRVIPFFYINGIEEEDSMYTSRFCFILTVIFIIIAGGDIYAAEIRGVVLDRETETPLPGASVAIKGSDIGKLADNNGKFSLTVTDRDSCTVTAMYVGYKDDEVTVLLDKTDSEVVLLLTPDPFITETVVVTAAKNRRRIVDSVETVNVVTAETIEDRNAVTITDLMRDVPGVSMNLGPNPDRERPEIRGMGAERVLMSVDGAKMNLTTMNVGDTHVVGDDIERIEIVKGPSSALYGSSAMGGVINIITKEPRQLLARGRKIGGRLKYNYSGLNANSTESLQLYGIIGDTFDWKASASRRDGKYLMVDSNDSSKLKNGAEAKGDNYRLDGIYRLNAQNKLKLQYERYGYYPVTEPGEVDSVEGGTYYDYQKREYRRDLQQVIYSFSGTGSALTALEFRAYRQLTDVTDQDEERSDIEGFPPVREIVIEKDENQLDTYGVDVKATSMLVQSDSFRHMLTYGAEYMGDNFHQVTEGTESTYLSDGDGGFGSDPSRVDPITEARAPDTEYQVYSAYLQDEIMIGKRLIIVPGIRFDSYNAVADKETDGYDQSLIDDSTSRETALSPKLGAVVKFTKDQSVTFNFGRGFRVPSKGELYYAFNMANIFYIVPNPSLKPETCLNYELSHKIQNSRLFGSTGVFYTRYNDFIGGRYLAPVAGEVLSRYQYINKDRVDIWGIESSYDVRFGKDFSTAAGFTWHRGEYRESGQRLEGLHKPKITMTCKYSPVLAGIRMKFTAGGRYVSAVDYYVTEEGDAGEEISNLSEYGGYTILDLGASFTFRDNYRLNLFVNNALDKEYQEFSNLLLPSPGRYASVSLSVTY